MGSEFEKAKLLLSIRTNHLERCSFEQGCSLVFMRSIGNNEQENHLRRSSLRKGNKSPFLRELF
ncbi:hypothetical protein DLM78_10285 [Leptospira stimsonii]|uniref:Uncharacterized protein n=1 Tax=Leptospira stimsonii TaxID=2202203 RepID=A0A8B3CRV9_9LEPT|nr:hypothetical protein DLM78_10285 [Leptospira stimsonii]